MPCTYKHPTLGSCQFGASEPTNDWEGLNYCQWHLPLGAKSAWGAAQRQAFVIALEALLDKFAEDGGKANFAGVVFPGNAWFHGRTLVNAIFHSATFSGYTNFGSTTFSGDTYFNSATFGGDANFESAKFGGDAHFDASDDPRTKPFRVSIFTDAKFLAGTSFDNRIFMTRGDFRGASFAIAPSFHGLVEYIRTWRHVFLGYDEAVGLACGLQGLLGPSQSVGIELADCEHESC